MLVHPRLTASAFPERPARRSARAGEHGISRFSRRRTPYMRRVSACYLILLPAAFLFWLVSLDGLAHVVAGGRAAVLRSGRSAGSGSAGFRRAGQTGQCLADVAEPAADPGGGQPAGRAGPLPGQPEVFGESAGQPELGVAGDDDPGPPVGGRRITQLRARPAENLFQEPERVFDIKPAQERLPGAVHLIGGGPGAGGP